VFDKCYLTFQSNHYKKVLMIKYREVYECSSQLAWASTTDAHIGHEHP